MRTPLTYSFILQLFFLSVIESSDNECLSIFVEVMYSAYKSEGRILVKSYRKSRCQDFLPSGNLVLQEFHDKLTKFF
jgi:DNA-binding FadR family transcriptional regulator